MKLRNPLIVTLSGAGIRPQSGGIIPWDDVDAVGTGRVPGGPGGTNVIGISLKSADRYVASFNSEQVRLMRGAARTGRLMGAQLPAAPGSGNRSGQQALRLLPQRDVTGMLQWSRRMSGWDVTFSPLLFKGRARDVVRKIENYHQAVLMRSSLPQEIANSAAIRR